MPSKNICELKMNGDIRWQVDFSKEDKTTIREKELTKGSLSHLDIVL
jgi:hypothetical protein